MLGIFVSSSMLVDLTLCLGVNTHTSTALMLCSRGSSKGASETTSWTGWNSEAVEACHRTCGPACTQVGGG